MANANCTQENHILDLSNIFSELIELSEAQRLLIDLIPDNTIMLSRINCAFSIFQERLETILENGEVLFLGKPKIFD